MMTSALSGGAASDVYHRLESRTQTAQDAKLQVATGEVWGCPAAGWGGIAAVRAYVGGIGNGNRGIEFTTPIIRTRGAGSPFEARWYAPPTQPHSPGAWHNNQGCVVIPANVSNHQP